MSSKPGVFEFVSEPTFGADLEDFPDCNGITQLLDTRHLHDRKIGMMLMTTWANECGRNLFRVFV